MGHKKGGEGRGERGGGPGTGVEGRPLERVDEQLLEVSEEEHVGGLAGVNMLMFTRVRREHTLCERVCAWARSEGRGESGHRTVGRLLELEL